MMDPVDRLVRSVARRNSFVLLLAQFGAAHVVMLGGLGLLKGKRNAVRLWAPRVGADVADGPRAVRARVGAVRSARASTVRD